MSLKTKKDKETLATAIRLLSQLDPEVLANLTEDETEEEDEDVIVGEEAPRRTRRAKAEEPEDEDDDEEDEDGAKAEFLDSMELDMIKELAAAFFPDDEKKIGRLRSAKRVAKYFDDVPLEAIQAAIGDEDEEDGDEDEDAEAERQELLDGLKVSELKEVLVELEVSTAAKLRSKNRAKLVELLEDVETDDIRAVLEVGEDDEEEDEGEDEDDEAREELLSNLGLKELRTLAVDVGSVKKTEAKKLKKRAAILEALEDVGLADIEAALEYEDTGEEDEEDEEEPPPPSKPGRKKPQTRRVGGRSRKPAASEDDEEWNE